MYMCKLSRFLLLISLLNLGCGAGIELNRLPRCQIDRPLALPDEVHTWHTVGVSLMLEELPYGWKNDVVPGGLLAWTQSATDRLDIHWVPIPLGFTYRLIDRPLAKAAINGGTSLHVDSSRGTELTPQLSVLGRARLSRWLALETGVGMSATFRSDENQATSYAYGLQLGPFVQLTPTIAFACGFGIVSADPGAKGIPLHMVSSYDDDVHVGSRSVPLYLAMAWSMHQQWELVPFYNYYSIGYEDDFTCHVFGVVLQHFFIWNSLSPRPDGIGY